jgi:hypothetical protein
MAERLNHTGITTSDVVIGINPLTPVAPSDGCLTASPTQPNG